MDDGVGHSGASQAVAFLIPGRIRKIEEGFVSRILDRENLIDMLSAHGMAKHGRAPQDPRAVSVAKIVKLENAWRRLDGRNDDGVHVASCPGTCDPVGCRSELRCAGNELVSTGNARWWPD